MMTDVSDPVPTSADDPDIILAADAGDMEVEAHSGRYQLKKLKTKHRQVLSLIAQGEPRWKVASLCDITPEYVTMLCAMPICQAYLSEMTQAAGVQLEAMFVKSVDVISNAMEVGDIGDQLKAARLQMEATKRIGAAGATTLNIGDGGDRLERLANRLIGLLDNKQVASGRTVDGTDI
jgi:hypothetical protein